MRRTWACLGLGVVLWTLLGAVQGATYWQVEATGYLAGLAATGLVLGLVWPGPALRTGVLLAVPGVAALLVGGTGDHPDAGWWFLTLVLGAYGAAGCHWLAAELRRRIHTRMALPPGSRNR